MLTDNFALNPGFQFISGLVHHKEHTRKLMEGNSHKEVHVLRKFNKTHLTDKKLV